MRLKLKRLSLALALMMCHSASAHALTADELFTYCASRDEVDHVACRYYILGAIEGVSLGDGAIIGNNGLIVEKAKSIFCIPEGTPIDQIIAAFQNAMRPMARSHPEDIKLPALGVFAATMTRAFPCR